jgi:hypothetical protein
VPPSPGACKLIARLDPEALPRLADWRPWRPPGLAEGAPEAEVVRALAAAWGTPAWVLALAGRVAVELGIAERADAWIACDPAYRPGSAVDRFCAPSATRLAEGGLEQAWPGPWWCNPPWSASGRWADKALAEAAAGRPGVFLGPVSNGRWHSRLAAAAAAAVDISPLAFDPCPGLRDFAVVNCPYGVRLYFLAAGRRPRVRPRVLEDAGHPQGVACALWAGPCSA